MIMKNLKMVVDSFYIPKDNPLKPYGEDAHFFHKEAQVIGVADGVGGSSKNGIDAGEYARELMRNAEFAVDRLRRRRPGEVDPKKILTEAFYRTEALGSSTACIVSLAGDSLAAANIGDSGFLVMRDGKVFYRSPVQQHRFNYPYQLGRRSKTGPEAAEELVVRELRGGEVLVVGSDGLFDNLFPEEIETIVNGSLDWSYLPEDLARAALWKSSPMNKTAGCPFLVAGLAACRRNRAAVLRESLATDADRVEVITAALQESSTTATAALEKCSSTNAAVSPSPAVKKRFRRERGQGEKSKKSKKATPATTTATPSKVAALQESSPTTTAATSSPEAARKKSPPATTAATPSREATESPAPTNISSQEAAESPATLDESNSLSANTSSATPSTAGPPSLKKSQPAAGAGASHSPAAKKRSAGRKHGEAAGEKSSGKKKKEDCAMKKAEKEFSRKIKHEIKKYDREIKHVLKSAKSKSKLNSMRYQFGGKYDDVTVVVAHIVLESDFYSSGNC